jgi:hypothetical protein
MFKRVTIVALVVAAFLLLAVPALAFNGFRGDYTTSNACQSCHSGQFAGVPAVYNEWIDTKHAVAGNDEQALRLPYGSVCQGCHTSNFDPAKVVPTPTATNTSTGAVSWGAGNGIPTMPQTEGNAASSENFVGCSSCHYGMSIGGNFGSDANNTAHAAPKGLLANAEICGQCHSRYSYTTQTFNVSPIPAPVQTTLIQPQMALGGYPMLGAPSSPGPGWDPAPPLSDYLNVQFPGWSPTPNPAATQAGFSKLQTYWQSSEGDVMMWQQQGHDGSAAQYPDWAIEGHANALTGLTSQSFWGFLDETTKKECLECHSTDFRIMEEDGVDPSSADAQYGVTCVGCHTPHENTTQGGAWDEEWTPQLRTGSAQTLCVQCHNGEIPEGTTASPGAEIHHPMKEMIDGYGAIDVSSFPSVHKGKCVVCHMPPTSVARGSVQLGGNHTFNIIEPEVALEASPIPVVTAVATATASPSGTITTTSTVTWDSMPYSACSTCHANNNGVRATPRPISTTIATPSPTATPLRVNVTINQTANQSAWGNFSGGDRAVWLQDTIEQRQEWTKAKIAEIWAELDRAAVRLGYADLDEAHTALVAVSAARRTTAETALLMGFTNAQFVESEGSFGLHNWDYSREIVNKAMQQARTAATGVIVKLPYKPTLSLSKSSVNSGGKVKYSGKVTTARGVAAAGKVKIMKRVGGVWKVWKSTQLNASGQYSLTVKMTSKGTFYFRALMSADSLNKAGYSGSRKLTVK